MIFPGPLFFISKEKRIYNKLFIHTKDSKESKKYRNSKDYLESFKAVLNLPNEVEKEVEKNDIKYKSLLSIIENNNYVITNDNFKKMILLLYKIKANVPLILVGETGCGKTS